jgi:hypothetical protein
MHREGGEAIDKKGDEGERERERVQVLEGLFIGRSKHEKEREMERGMHACGKVGKGRPPLLSNITSKKDGPKHK